MNKKEFLVIWYPQFGSFVGCYKQRCNTAKSALKKASLCASQFNIHRVEVWCNDFRLLLQVD